MSPMAGPNLPSPASPPLLCSLATHLYPKHPLSSSGRYSNILKLKDLYRQQLWHATCFISCQKRPRALGHTESGPKEGAAMKRTLNIPNRSSFLPLRDAVLCNDCEFISADSGEVCSVCGSRSLLRLKELVSNRHGSASLTPKDVFRFFRMRLGSEAS